MNKLILVRHGQSVYNLEHRFTGWHDSPLTKQGLRQAVHAGELLRAAGLIPKQAFTSLLTRATQTLEKILQAADCLDIPVSPSWRLNERHYGALQGLTRTQTYAQFGQENVLRWRRSYKAAPPPTGDNSAAQKLAPPGITVPNGESLQACLRRLQPYWEQEILSAFQYADTILIAAHEDLLRGFVQKLKALSEVELEKQVIPPATPWVFELDEHGSPLRDYFLGDQQEIQRFLSKLPQ